jgi:thioesterase domain-containing protein/aryl carrier-like protein
LADHAVLDTVLVPGAVFVELALRAGAEVGCELLEELALCAPLVLAEQGGVQLRVSVAESDEEGRRALSVHSRLEVGLDGRGGGEWSCHAEGALSSAASKLDSEPSAREDGFSEIALPGEQAREAERFGIHPALLDAALSANLSNRDGGELSRPVSWRGVCMHARGAASLRIPQLGSEEGQAFTALGDSGLPVVSIESFTCEPIEQARVEAARERLSLAEESAADSGARFNGEAGAGSLSQRLAGVPEAEREAVALELVRSHVAVLLGHASGEDVDPERGLLELGFDSVGAMELRKQLTESAGVELPVSVLVSRPTVAALARHLLALLDGSAPSAAGTTESSSTFLSLLRGTQSDADAVELIELIAAASRFRPTFEAAEAATSGLDPIPLAEGGETPGLFLFPSIMAMSGPHEYARFARRFRGNRQAFAVPASGFVAGERLPDSAEAAAQAGANALLRCEGPDDFAIVGYSSGGWLAHVVAAHLESIGVFPKAVILLDTYLNEGGGLGWLTPSLTRTLYGGEQFAELIDDARLTAMAAYFRLFAEWTPSELAAPVTLVRAAEPMPTMQADDPEQWPVSWRLPHTATDVPGNHFSMMIEHAETTAQAVEEALETQLAGSAANRGGDG